MDNEKIDLKLILLIVAIVLSLIALIWVGVVSAKISTFDKKISDTQTAVASLTSYMASTTSVLNERMTQVERLEMTQQSTISSLTSYFKNMYSDLSGKIIAEDQKNKQYPVKSDIFNQSGWKSFNEFTESFNFISIVPAFEYCRFKCTAIRG
jgi:cytoskeletal protein RodZ